MASDVYALGFLGVYMCAHTRVCVCAHAYEKDGGGM